MFVCLWSAKGGSGVTVTAASMALAMASCDTPTLLVDFGGDVAPALAAPAMSRPAGDPDEFLGREREVAPSLSLVDGPAWSLDPPAALAVAASLALDPRPVIVDLGPHRELVEPFTRRGAESLLVTRPCYLALRRAAGLPGRPDGVVLLDEPGRALRESDVAEVVAAPVRTTLPVTAAVARAVDAGLLAHRMPAELARPLLGLCHVPG